jgi:hypothetical protein
MAAVPAVAGAATFTVTNYGDPSAGTCVPGSCSLRQAVAASNLNSGADTINVRAGVYTLKQPTQDLGISDSVTINAVGGDAIVGANGPFTGTRAFEVFANASVTFNDISVRNGIGPKDADGEDRGGAIRVDKDGSLTLNGGSIRSSELNDTGSQGGGIYTAGKLNLNGVDVTDNKTGFAFGGGIYASDTGYATVKNSVIANNSSSFGGGIAGTGGAQVTDSVVHDNSAGLGGALYASGCGSFKFEYSTLDNNDASGNAGAVRARDADVFLFHSTVSGNQAFGNGGRSAVKANGTCPTQIYTGNSIIAGNTAGGGTSPDCLDENGSGNVTDQGHNIVGDAIGCGLTGATGDQLGSSGSPIDPQLGPLANNGGPTETMALQATSPATGKADPSSCGTTDQRGFSIAHDGDAGCDVGAYELLQPPTDTGAKPAISGTHRVGSLLTCTTGAVGRRHTDHVRVPVAARRPRDRRRDRSDAPRRVRRSWPQAAVRGHGEQRRRSRQRDERTGEDRALIRPACALCRAAPCLKGRPFGCRGSACRRFAPGLAVSCEREGEWQSRP